MRRRRHAVAQVVAVCLSAGSVWAAGADLQLIEAVKARDHQSVRALLDQGVDVNAREGDGATALHWAVERDDAEVAEALLRAGADETAANDYGVTPASLACLNRNEAMLERLLAAGADPNAATSMGETLLMTCAGTGAVDAVATLFDRGATNVNAKEASYGQTALMRAAAQDNPEVVRLLLAHGADIHARSTTYLLPVSLGNPLDNVGGGAVMAPQRGYTPLLFTARHGRVENVRLLLDAGADVNDTAPTGESALVVASFSGHGQVAALLLDRGADPNDQGAGYTPLHTAVVRGDLELVEALCARGADPNARLTEGSQQRREAYWFALSERWRGATPFWLAAKFAEVDIMRALVDSSADPLLAANDGTTPLMSIAGIGYRPGSIGMNRRDQGIGPDAAKLLKAANEQPTLEGTRLVLELGGDVNAANDNGDTAAHGAAVLGYASVVELLAEHGADLDVENQRGQTAQDVLCRQSPSHSLCSTAGG